MKKKKRRNKKIKWIFLLGSLVIVTLLLILYLKQNRNTDTAEEIGGQEEIPEYNLTVISPDSEENADCISNHVKCIGRTYQSTSGTLWLSQSATGIEFTFTGNLCQMEIKSDDRTDWTNGSSYAIYIDGNRTMDGKVNQASEVVTVFNSQAAETHTIRLIKITEAMCDSMGISQIITNEGATISPTENKSLYIEFVGDSLTCGYGLGEVGCNQFQEDPTKTYAYLTAQALDCDYSIFGFSGNGVSMMDDTYVNRSAVIWEKYPYTTAFADATIEGNSALSTVPYDFARQPDVVVINLGTNDSVTAGSDAANTVNFTNNFVWMLTTIRSHNPMAKIICAYGMMDDSMSDTIQTAIQSYQGIYYDNNVYYLQLPHMDDQYAAQRYQYHPVASDHVTASGVLVNEIKSLLGQ